MVALRRAAAGGDGQMHDEMSDCENCKKLEAERQHWLELAQRLFKERQTILHGHQYDLPSDDVILEASLLEMAEKKS
jgi:hypothetical protein